MGVSETSREQKKRKLKMYSYTEEHRVGRELSFFSSRRNWDSPNPSPAGECAPFGSGGKGTLAGERAVGRVPVPTKGHTLWYSVNIRTLCCRRRVNEGLERRSVVQNSDSYSQAFFSPG